MIAVAVGALSLLIATALRRSGIFVDGNRLWSIEAICEHMSVRFARRAHIQRLIDILHEDNWVRGEWGGYRWRGVPLPDYTQIVAEALTVEPSGTNLTICNSPASAGALMVADFNAFTSPRNCSESRNSARLTVIVGIPGPRRVKRTAPRRATLPASRTIAITTDFPLAES